MLTHLVVGIGLAKKKIWKKICVRTEKICGKKIVAIRPIQIFLFKKVEFTIFWLYSKTSYNLFTIY